MGRRRRAIAERREQTTHLVGELEIGEQKRNYWGLVDVTNSNGQEGLVLTRKGLLVTILTLTVSAFAVRLLFYLANVHTELITVPILDARAYLTWAQEILDGIPRPLGAFFTEPGYAYLIALSLSWFHSYIPVLWLQLLLGSTVPAIVFCITRKIVRSDVPAILAGVLMVFLRSAVFHDAVLLKTSLELWSTSVFILVLVYVWEHRTVRNFFMLGLVGGVAALIKANILYVIPLLAMALFIPRPQDSRNVLKISAALIIGAALAISPATIHNYRATGALIPINYSGGVTVYIGNWEMADGSFMVPEYFSLDPIHEENSWHALAEAFSGRSLNAQETSSFWLREGISEAFQNPGHTISVTLKKIYLLIAGEEIADNYPVSFGELTFPALKFFVPFWLLSLLGIAGMILFVRRARRHPFHLYAFIIGFSGLIVISKVAERYRLALATVLVVFAGYSLYRLWILWRDRMKRTEAFALTTLLVLAGLALVVVRPTIVSTGHEDVYLSFGSQYLDNNDLEKAKKMFEAGIALSPLHEPLIQQYSKVLLLEGNVEQALESYRDALRARADGSTKGLEIAYTCLQTGCTSESVQATFKELEDESKDWTYQKEYLEGMRAFRRGDSDTAIDLFTKAYGVNPKIRGLKSNIALIYGKEGNQAVAQDYLTQAVADNNFDVIAHYNLGNAYSRANDYANAIPHYKWVNELVPDFNLARYNLARSYLNTGESWKAREEFLAFITYAEDHGLFEKEVEKSKQAVGMIENTLLQGLVPQQTEKNQLPTS